MKDGMRKTLGKTISSIVVGNSERNPKIQVFLVFDDETYFEFWGHSSVVPVGSIAAGFKRYPHILRNVAARSRRYIPDDRAKP